MDPSIITIDASWDFEEVTQDLRKLHIPNPLRPGLAHFTGVRVLGVTSTEVATDQRFRSQK